MKKSYLDEIAYSHGSARCYHLSQAGKIVLHNRICETDREIMIENSENDAKVMEVPPNYFTSLDDNRVKLLRRGIPVICKGDSNEFRTETNDYPNARWPILGKRSQEFS